MHEHIQRKYTNVCRKTILKFSNYKEAFPKKGVVVKPLLFSEVSAILIKRFFLQEYNFFYLNQFSTIFLFIFLFIIESLIF